MIIGYSLIQKILAFLLIFISLLVVSAAPVAAQDDTVGRTCRDQPNSTLCNSNSAQNFNNNSFFGTNGVLTRAARLIAIVTGIAAVAMIMYGAYKYVVSNGDPSNITAARNMIIYALAGLAIAAISQAIIVYVLNNI